MDFSPLPIPADLTDRDQWICWTEAERDGQVTKIPKQPDGSGANAKSNDMATWGSFEQAVETAQEKDSWGIGFVFSSADPYVFVDIDDAVVDRGGPKEWLPSLGDFLGETYLEYSPSGDGIHLILDDVYLPDWWKNNCERYVCPTCGDFFDKSDALEDHLDDVHDEDEDVDTDHEGVEIYTDGRYSTFTGWQIDGSADSLGGGQEEFLEWLIDVWKEFHGEHPIDWQSGDSGAEAVDLSLYDVVSRSEFPEGENREHPIHGSSHDPGRNFMVDEGAETFRCWRHGVTGNALHMVGMQEGIISCGEWTGAGLEADTWRDIFDAARDRGLDVPEREGAPARNGGTALEPAPPPDTEAESEGTVTNSWSTIRGQYREAHQNYANTTEVRHQARYVATRKLVEEEGHFATNEQSDKLHVYDPDLGIYVERGKAFVQERLVDELQEQFSTNELNEIVAQIKGRTFHHPEEFGGPAGYVCVANGILEIGRNGVDRVIDHTPEFLFQNRVETDYNPDAECPRWRGFLQDVVPDEQDRLTLQEYAGYTLLNWGMPHAKALFVAGPTASGKSTFLDVIRHLLGEDSVSNIAPQQFGRNRFATYKLWGAWANIRNDIDSDVVKNIGLFKEMTAGDPIYVEEKNQEGFEITPTAKHLYSANQLPEIETDDEAFYRRIVLVSFPHSVPPEERIPKEKFQSQLLEESEGILNWAIAGLNRVMEQGGFTGDLPPAETKAQWDEWGNAIGRFKSECLIKEVDAFVEKSVAHSAFVAFCDENGLPSTSQQKLTRELKKDKDISDAHRTPDGKGRQVRAYTGIRLKEEWQPDDGDDDDDDDDRAPDGKLDDF